MGLSLRLGLNNYRVSIGGYDAAAQAVFDEATAQGYTQPSNDVKGYLNTLIVELKASGIWNKLDVLYILATDGDRDFAKINIKNPGTFDLVEINTPTFTSLQGFTSAAGAALNTQYNSLTDGINASVNDQSLFTWLYTAPASDSQDQVSIGSNSIATSFGGTYIKVRENSFSGPGNRLKSRLNSTGETTFTDLVAASGLHLVTRNDGSTFRMYQNGVVSVNSGSVSNATNDADIYVCALNNATAVNSRTKVPISVAGIAADLTSEQAYLYSAINTYMSSL